MLLEDLQNALRQIYELKSRNRQLEEKLLMAGAGKRATLPVITGIWNLSTLLSVKIVHLV